ncbi:MULTISPECIES: hypothetical protein [Brevibacillus]|jgi:hypothetical protein|uniref:YtzI protein n=1 Tax=Brevibacillus borstelensis AK1 TaxID=1300222 RepID=M8E5V5_9BACL|nr:hypothetical protein I532_19656 [Brevibacillus borstelensis AK1]GED55727.1 hypothetical protein BBO01nite_49680 [Brevibacillus borstelensis]
MNTGFLIALVIVSILIIWITIWVTNKAYGRKPDVIDPIQSTENNDPLNKEPDRS